MQEVFAVKGCRRYPFAARRDCKVRRVFNGVMPERPKGLPC